MSSVRSNVPERRNEKLAFFFNDRVHKYNANRPKTCYTIQMLDHLHFIVCLPCHPPFILLPYTYMLDQQRHHRLPHNMCNNNVRLYSIRRRQDTLEVVLLTGRNLSIRFFFLFFFLYRRIREKHLRPDYLRCHDVDFIE